MKGLVKAIDRRAVRSDPGATRGTIDAGIVGEQRRGIGYEEGCRPHFRSVRAES